jgi:predicted dehydrogenase
MKRSVFSLGIIGCGARAAVLLRNLRSIEGFGFRIGGLYDIDGEAARGFSERWADEKSEICGSYEEVIEAKPDAVLVTTINSAHLRPAMLCIEGSIPLYLEKPLAATWEDTYELITAWRKRRTPVVVGFVLRYTRFYRRIEQLCRTNALGRIVTLHAEENFGPSLVSLFLRGWRRFRRNAGPILLEKCCHDLDLLNWFSASLPKRVSSLGARTAFVPRPELPERCRGCPLYDSCPYRFEYPAGSERFLDDGAREYSEELPDLCVWNAEKDIFDHQSVIVEYENGAIATLVLNMCAEQTRRTIRIHGTEGRLDGDLHLGSLTRVALSGGAEVTHRLEAANESGHYGGDRVIAKEMVRMLRDPEHFVPSSSLEDGFVSSLVAFTADRSAREGRTVPCSELIDGGP